MRYRTIVADPPWPMPSSGTTTRGETDTKGPRLEMFARRQRLGWDTWGNEALEHVEIA